MLRFFWVVVAGVVATSCSSVPVTQETRSSSGTLVGTLIHACECDVYCPCPFAKDADYAKCRSLTIWLFDEGQRDSVDLSGASCTLSMTEVGKNVGESRGTWEGILFIPADYGESRAGAVEGLVRDIVGDGYARLDVRREPYQMTGGDGTFELTIGDTVQVTIEPLHDKWGEVPRIVNPPSPPMGLRDVHAGIASVHTYDDDAMSWVFNGRNAYFGPISIGQGDAPIYSGSSDSPNPARFEHGELADANRSCCSAREVAPADSLETVRGP